MKSKFQMLKESETYILCDETWDTNQVIVKKKYRQF